MRIRRDMRSSSVGSSHGKPAWQAPQPVGARQRLRRAGALIVIANDVLLCWTGPRLSTAVTLRVSLCLARSWRVAFGVSRSAIFFVVPAGTLTLAEPARVTRPAARGELPGV